jgi:hypothetical protein
MKNKLLLVFVISLLILSIHFFILKVNYTNFLITGDNAVFSTTTTLNCNPILANRTQFTATIDSIRYPSTIPLYHNVSLNFTCLNSNPKIKTILLWTNIYAEPFDTPVYGIGHQFKKNHCPVTNCEFTDNKAHLSRSQLVLFHIRNKIYTMPERAFATQRFVHMIYEPPIHCHLCDKFDDSVFNFSATHTPESDYSSIYWTNSGLYWAVNASFNTSTDRSLNKKNATAAALISNCDYQYTDRLKYIKELNRTFNVDVYGNCGDYKCPANIADCKAFIASQFKFYLSFENSACNGYITEKFFDWLNYDIVPVVLGLGNYSYYIPKSAYINALNFKSPRELGAYLSYLDRNATAYNEFFKWKRFISTEYFTERKLMGFLCEMCIQLHLEEAVGHVKEGRLTDLKRRFGLFENCGVGEVSANGSYSVGNVTSNIYSYFLGDRKR